MATIDPRRLKPTELCRLLNSTPLGEVISERQLHRHRTRAGYRIGDGKTVDLFRYVAWLVSVRHAPKPDAEPTQLTGYDAIKEQARERNKRLSLSGRNIGEIPPVVNPERKAMACASFQGFCETYFPQTFHLPWSDDHLKVIAKIEKAVLEGGLFAMAMPRGSGKTTLCETACLWAILIGAREYVCLIGSDEEHAASMLESIKSELENNELLLEDFPEAVYPIHCLEGIHQRASGQLYNGSPTHIGWTAKRIVMPTIQGSKASGAIIGVAGITGRIRGMKHKRPDGKAVRPSLVLTDDPQTDESARSLSQCETREKLVAGAILGLAGPGNKIAGLMTLTVVRPILLMVPSAKSLTGAPPPLGQPSIDHFQCYVVRNARARRARITVTDQFGTRTLDVKRPSRLCTAVDKRNEGVLNPDDNLLCYEVRTSPGTRRFTGPGGPVYIDNQFGPDTLKVTRPTELCVPSVVYPPQQP